MPSKKFALSLFAVFAIFSAFAFAAERCDCKIDGVCYSSGQFTNSSDACLVCDPGNSTSSWSTTLDQCKCLCAVQRDKVPQECAGEILFRCWNGACGASPNVLDANQGGCSANWCAGNQSAKRCAITSNYSSSPYGGISIVADRQSPSLCTGHGNLHLPQDYCTGNAPEPVPSVVSAAVPPAAPQGNVIAPPSDARNKNVFASNPNQSFYDKAHEFVYGYPATTVNVTNITQLIVFPAGVEKPEEQETNFVIGEMVNVGYGVAQSTNNLSTIQCNGPSLCECKISPVFKGGMTLFQCTFFPYVNGTYNLYIRDVYGNDNSKFVNAVKLIPNQPPGLVYQAPQDRLVLVLLALVLVGMIIFAFVYYATRLRGGGPAMRLLCAKKARVEDDLKTIQYRFMKRELTQEQYLQQYAAKQAELSEVQTRLREEEERQKTTRRKYRLPF